jgi:hypothetical protein
MLRRMGSGGVVSPFLTSVLDEGEWSASRPGRLTPGERSLATHWIGGWVGPRAGLDAVEKRKFLVCRELNPGRPARSLSLCRLSYLNSGSWMLHGVQQLAITWIEQISICYTWYWGHLQVVLSKIIYFRRSRKQTFPITQADGVPQRENKHSFLSWN